VLLVSEQGQTREDQWFLALVQHSSDLIIVVDADGVVTYANPAASVMFGVSLEEAVGTSAFRYVHHDDFRRVVARHALLAREPTASIVDAVRFVSATGEERVLEIVATNCLDVPAVAGIVINGRDVTERNGYMVKLEASFDAITNAMANVVELRDPYTAGHQRQVADIATAIARELALPDDTVKGIGAAATLHDIGKIAIPAEILNRPGRLSPAEFEIIKTHPRAGYQILSEVPFPWPVADMVLQHHERLDGSGYPNGLKGSAIPIGCRVIAVADVVSAMSAHRPYRPSVGTDAALAEIEAGRGRLYDAVVVDACVRLVREGRLPLTPSTPS
jgi:PAS domain S-box-containing protein/putative nucleotidyltransferase with HDIG domain